MSDNERVECQALTTDDKISHLGDKTHYWENNEMLNERVNYQALTI